MQQHHYTLPLNGGSLLTGSQGVPTKGSLVWGESPSLTKQSEEVDLLQSERNGGWEFPSHLLQEPLIVEDVPILTGSLYPLTFVPPRFVSPSVAEIG